MPRNDRSDSLSVRSDDDPRRPLKALQQEAERELLGEEAGHRGGPAHRSPAAREGAPARKPDAATRDTGRDDAAGSKKPRQAAERPEDEEALRKPDGDAVTGGGGNVTRGPTGR